MLLTANGQKLCNYFRNRFKGKKLHAQSINKILGVMQSLSGPGKRPRRLPAVVVYSKLHYTARVKPEFDKIWAEAKLTTPATARVSMSQDFVRTCWEKESPELKAEVELAAEEMHRVAMEAWRAKRKTPERSAEDYHKYVSGNARVDDRLTDACSALENLSEVGIPLADALAEHTGAHIVILVVGPVGAAGGEVLLRS
jgi:hypothetical protein